MIEQEFFKILKNIVLPLNQWFVAELFLLGIIMKRFGCVPNILFSFFSWLMSLRSWASSLFLRSCALRSLAFCNWVLRLICWLISVLLPLTSLFSDYSLISPICGCNAGSGGNVGDSGLDWFIRACNNLTNRLRFTKVCLVCL